MLDSIQSASGVTIPFNDLGGLISDILTGYIFYAAGLILLVYMISGGLGMMLSRGDPKAFEGGKQKITNALIGFIIVFAAFWIIRIVGDIFNLSIFEDVFTGPNTDSAPPPGGGVFF